MAKPIIIAGLTPRQKVLANIMWNLSEKEAVERFIGSLPVTEAKECRALIQLMIASYIDNVDTVGDEALDVINRARS